MVSNALKINMFSPISVFCFTAALAIASARVTSRGDGYGIIGGGPAKITELPHQVYITLYGDFNCGGSIISRYHILTAAHCAKYDLADLGVVLGTDNKTAGDGQVFQLAKKTVHENYTKRYSPFESLNDIAVLTLAKKIKLSKKVRIIPLAKPKHQVKGGTELIASGWGLTTKTYYGNDSDILKKVTVLKVDFDGCYQTYKEQAVVTENMICAGGQSGKGVFSGDSGGALLQKTKKGYLQVGIASWVHVADEPGFPDVYTQVSKYYKWIKEVLKQDLESKTDLKLPHEFDF